MVVVVERGCAVSAPSAPSYTEFLASKRRLPPSSGIACDVADVQLDLFEFQRHLVAWAVRRGRAAVWADTGLGKSRVQVEWLRIVLADGGRGLILAPLAVTQQTIREAEAIGTAVTYVRNDAEARAATTRIVISNYERLDQLDPGMFDAVVLDESSILKAYSGVTKRALVAAFANTRYRLCCTATPAPNDLEELCNHADFLGVMSPQEMRSTFFIADSRGEFMRYRLKGHARGAFYDWLASWAIACRLPSDLGFIDDGYVLPPLTITDHLVETGWAADGELFTPRLEGITQRAQVRRDTLTARTDAAAAVVLAEPDERWLVWCGTNDEAHRMTALLADLAAVNVQGSDHPEAKAAALLDFADGNLPVLVTKPSLAGYGLNFQACARMVFVGLSDCYDEQTEVLTRTGWKSFGKVTLDDDLATVHPETQAFEWQAPSRVVWEPYSGPMLHFHGQRNFDLLVTPNHKLYVQRCPGRYSTSDGSWGLRYADDLASQYRWSEYRMLSAPTCGDGERPDWIDIPSHGRLSSRSRAIERITSEDFMRLAGWYLSEGYCRPIDSAERGRIVICQTEMFPAHRAEIIALLSRVGLNVNAKTKDITGYSVNLAAYLIDQFGSGSHDKHIPRWVKDLHPDLLVILRDTLMKGDGATAGGYYKSASGRLRDDFQEICLRTGIRASVHGDYVSLAWQNTRPAIHREPETVNYHGMIGCATVPNHTLIVRRNGIPVVSGNSYEQYYQAIRRCYRFGQIRPVGVHVVLADVESVIAQNVRAKERVAAATTEGLVAAIASENRRQLFAGTSKGDDYQPRRVLSVPAWLTTEDAA